MYESVESLQNMDEEIEETNNDYSSKGHGGINATKYADIDEYLQRILSVTMETMTYNVHNKSDRREYIQLVKKNSEVSGLANVLFKTALKTRTYAIYVGQRKSGSISSWSESKYLLKNTLQEYGDERLLGVLSKFVDPIQAETSALNTSVMSASSTSTSTTTTSASSPANGSSSSNNQTFDETNFWMSDNALDSDSDYDSVEELLLGRRNSTKEELRSLRQEPSRLKKIGALSIASEPKTPQNKRPRSYDTTSTKSNYLKRRRKAELTEIREETLASKQKKIINSLQKSMKSAHAMISSLMEENKRLQNLINELSD